VQGGHDLCAFADGAADTLDRAGADVADRVDVGHGGAEVPVDLDQAALVALDVKEGRLVFPFDGPALPAWRYCSYVREARLDDPAIHTFLAWLSELGHRFSHHA